MIARASKDKATVRREARVALSQRLARGRNGGRPPRRSIFANQESSDRSAECIENEMAMVISPDEQLIPIIGEFKTRPSPSARGRGVFLLVGRKIESRKRGLVVVAEVVEEDRGCRLGCDRNDTGRRVEGHEIRGRKLQSPLHVSRTQIPDRNGVVLRAGDERVAARRDGQRGHLVCVTGKVTHVSLVVEIKQSQGVLYTVSIDSRIKIKANLGW